MKRILALLLILVGGLALIGCDDSDSNTLNTVSMFGGNDPNAAVYNSVIAKFEEETGWKVNDDSTEANQDWKESVVQMFRNGNEPDVLQFFTTSEAEPFISTGGVVSIEDIRKEYPDYAKNINPAVLGEYAIPTTGFVEGIFTNTEHFKSEASKAYLEKDSWTWAEFKTLLALLVAENTDIEGYRPISMGQNIPHYWIDHIIGAQFGVDYYKEITAASGKTKMVDALLKISEVKEFMSYELEESSATQGFLDKKYTFLLDGSWAMGNIIKEESAIDASKVEVFPFPAVNSSVGTPLLSGFTSGFYITKKAWDNPEKREKAIEFITMMTSTENLTKFAEIGGFASDDKAVPAQASDLAKKLAALSAKTSVNILPLGDASAPGSYTILVEGQGAYIGNNRSETESVVDDYLELQ